MAAAGLKLSGRPEQVFERRGQVKTSARFPEADHGATGQEVALHLVVNAHVHYARHAEAQHKDHHVKLCAKR